MKIIIVSDTADYLLVDKPAGFSVHRDQQLVSLLDLLRQQTGYPYLAPVHRLDQATSGLWLLAKTPASAAALSAQFEQRQVEKYYLALSDKKPSKKQGKVEGALVKARAGSYRLARSGEPWSVTQFFSYGLGDGCRLFLLKPLTGRTHQLRVVMRSLGAPILGDTRYGSSQSQADRCYLHAYSLAFSVGSELIRYTLPPAQGTAFLAEPCQQRLAELSAPWQLSWPQIEKGKL
ncbi:pseudouridine synthase [Litorivivens sp.]|uniref:pseudouridine synthase n=1 Tax=Litorivivens sp. TaxID=2020868 RepID=UPI00356B2DC9